MQHIAIILIFFYKFPIVNWRFRPQIWEVLFMARIESFLQVKELKKVKYEQALSSISL